MITFAELVETIDSLSEDERDQLWAILKKKKEQEILNASNQALKEYEEGKAISLSSPEEITSFFKNLTKDDHQFQ